MGFLCSNSNEVAYAETYSVTYVLYGGTNSSQNPTSVSSSDSAITLQPASKSGYKFIGWYKDPEFNNYVSKIKPSTMSGNLTLYAQFSQYISLPVKYSYTDFYNSIDETEGYINCYYYYYSYYYENISSAASMVSDHSEYTIYSTSNAALSLKQDDTGYFTTSDSGTPSYIRITSDPYYSVSYNCVGGSIPSNQNPYNYYYKRSNLTSNLPTPEKANAHFMGWYIDSGYTSTLYSSTFSPSNITLYAKWSDIHTIDAIFESTDFFDLSIETVLSIEFYEEEYDYIYSDNFIDLYSYHTDYDFAIYTSDGAIIPFYENSGTFASLTSYGVPAYIKYSTPKIYTISYELGEGAYLNDGDKLFNYYTKRADLKENTVEPKMDGYSFAGWYLNEEHDKTIYSSEFVVSNITLYASWQEKLYLDVYYYDTSLETPDYVLLGNMDYYLTETNEYFLGDMEDEASRLPFYFKQTGSTSYKAYTSENQEIHVYTNNGNLYASADSPIAYVRIYLHYSINFYVNGNLVYETRGAKGEQIAVPDFIVGYIGPNHNAIKIGSVTLGKEYALYIMKGWSLTDSSDITWLDQEEVDIIDESITYDNLVEGEYKLSLYAYMTFYGKVNAVNNDIDYEEYIRSTNGIVTSASPYTLDDLMLEHVTEISSDAQKSNFEKILKYFKLDSLGSNTLGLIGKLINGDAISFGDIWSSLLGKILTILISVAALFAIGFNIFNFVKAMSKIQSNS